MGIRCATKVKIKNVLDFKKKYGKEKYLTGYMSRAKRSLMAQFRTGILPLKIETGRFSNLAVEQRLCEFCPLHVEDEFHFLFQCTLYEDYRKSLLDKILTDMPDFNDLSKENKL